MLVRFLYWINLNYSLFYYKWGNGNISFDQSDNVSVHFKAFITPFITDTYNFTLVSDAGNVWSFDGFIANNNMNPVGNKTYYYNDVHLNAFQMYTILIDFADWGGNAEIELYWKTSTVSNQTIPSENLSIPIDVSSSPYQVTVNCPAGYIVGGSAMNQCVTHCGDGLVYGSEKWDDSNNANGDGWLSDWTAIENGWIWLNGSTTHKSEWSKWDSGYQSNSNYTQWEVSKTLNEVTITEVVTSWVIVVWAFSNVATMRTPVFLIGGLFQSIKSSLGSIFSITFTDICGISKFLNLKSIVYCNRVLPEASSSSFKHTI